VDCVNSYRHNSQRICLAAHAMESRLIVGETGGGVDTRVVRIDSREHPGTEADPPLVLVSPLVSVARGVAASSLVTRPAGV
jgi:hypothetical protein